MNTDTAKKDKARLNVVVIGHVDSGKSTLVARILYAYGLVTDKMIETNLKEGELLGKSSRRYAWCLDKLKSERERDITIDIKAEKVSGNKNNFTFIDAPGHRDFIKNMITGTSQADIAVLVVSAVAGEFEAGISKEGQTKEHALLSFSLGIKQIIVAVNKMDHQTVSYESGRYSEIKNEMNALLAKVGYKPTDVTFVPISAQNAENLIQPVASMQWYKEKTLMHILDDVIAPERPIAKPLRLPIEDVYKIAGIGTVPVGRVETGVLKLGMMLKFSPGGVTSECKSISQHHEDKTSANPGDNVGFNVRNVLKKDLHRGHVCSNATEDPAQETESFTAQVIVINHPTQIVSGYQPVVCIHTAHVACKFEDIMSKINRRDGSLMEEKPENIKNGDMAIVKMKPIKPICLESYADYPALGRFAVRDMRNTVAVGVISNVEKKECSIQAPKVKKEKVESKVVVDDK